MINIDKFIKTRKSLKLSQSALCKGICTQATLSKFENLGQIPSMKILTKLCERMNISLSDLIEEESQTEHEISSLFSKADFSLITYDYAKIKNILEQINFDQLGPEEKWHYTYLEGTVAVLGDQNYIEGLYYFNEIINDELINHQNIYYVLAKAGCGLVYEHQDDPKKAEHYYNEVFEVIMKTKVTSDELAIKILAILYAGGVFYSKTGDLQTSDSILNYAYKICAENHHVYYLARIIYQMAINAQKENRPRAIIEEHLADAYAFAKLNGNNHLIADIAEFKKGL